MSEKKLQDYASYYIGCKCFNTWFTPDHDAYNAGWILEGYRQDSLKPYLLGNETDSTWTDSIKPILIRLEDITDEEMKKIVLFRYSVKNTLVSVKNSLNTIEFKTNGFTGGGTISFSELSPMQFNFLLNRSYDLFDLIDIGLAIDYKTLK